MKDRTIEHPVIKEKLTFVRTSAETGGELTELIVELAPGGGNPPHVHESFAESFTPLEGQLWLRVGKERRTLSPGTTTTVPPGVLHSLANHSTRAVRFRVEVRPGQPGLERFAQIAYGLARDGYARKRGFPKKLAHLAILMEMADVRAPGFFFRISAPLLARIARRARTRGVEEELIERYCV